MANETIIQNLIFQLGQSQSDRTSPELDIHFADVDERTTQDFLQFAKTFATVVNYYRDDSSNPLGNWSNFFPDQAEIEALLTSSDASTTPHLALFLAFLELYKTPQNVINRITGRHLDFYYKDVLRLQKKAAVPDKVHMLMELKKNALPVLITPNHLFSAGKDPTGIERIYKPTRDTLINTAKVDSLRSLLIDQGTVRYAPIANSANGLGDPLPDEAPKWFGFGHTGLPPAEVGFAIAAPVLRMKEGERKITVTLTLSLTNEELKNLSNSALVGAFDVFLTGEKAWLGPYPISPQIGTGNLLRFSITLPETDKAVVDYDPVIHGYAYTAQAPVMQVLLKTEGAGITYRDFNNVLLQKAKVSVEVSNVTSLTLESDSGVLDAKKAFNPFGIQPTAGSRFLVGYPEALTKKLSEVTLSLIWKEVPTAKFATHYQGYGISGISNTYFTAAVAFQDGRGRTFSNPGVELFNSSDASTPQTLPPFRYGTPSTVTVITSGMIVNALHTTGMQWGMIAANQYVLRSPVFKAFKTIAPEVREGFITLTLQQGFGHDIYRKKYVEQVMKYSKEGGTLDLIKEPYTPKIQSISLTYKAESDEVNIASPLLNDFANSDLQFFHIAYFGQMREHGYQRQQFKETIDAAIAPTIPLLPAYPYTGELLIGFSHLQPGNSVSVLFQVADGSADPTLNPEPINWFVLCDNHWKPLSRAEVVLDTTNQLLTSGIIQFVIPLSATTSHTILPSDRIWLKASILGNVTAVCQLIEVAANAVELQFSDQGNDPKHLLTVLEQGTITKLKPGLAVVKSVKQPYASFGGSPLEADPAFYTRASERLRHKHRCITAWDYERMILEDFPNVHKVKCIPHARDNTWLSPGHVLIVVIPDLKNKNAIDRLRPKVDADTLSRITAYLKKYTGMQVQIQVKNPRYQVIQLDFKVKFYPGYEFNYYSTQLKQAIIEFLSPWAYSAEREITFGGKVYKSVLLDFVEDLPYVDYVTDFKLYSVIDSNISTSDLNTIQPETPDAILVSAESHIINPAL
jgi:Baseplate J-like protein